MSVSQKVCKIADTLHTFVVTVLNEALKIKN